MNPFKLVPNIVQFNTCQDFCLSFQIGKEDLLIVSEHTYKRYLSDLHLEAKIIFLRNYGQGEPTDVMVEAIHNDLRESAFKRVIAIGGGTILDVAKLFALKQITPVGDLFDHQLPFIKEKELILVPTTCGTGSEVTNISILELTKKGTKKGLAVDQLYPDYAVLIPELLNELPFAFFATSSIDAFIHALESYLSPKVTHFSQLFSMKAMEMIIKGYKNIEKNGKDARLPLMEDFMLASTYAGIAFGNAGCAAVHALSYPLGATFHVPHGEANYAILSGVFAAYQKLQPEGRLHDLNVFLSNLLICTADQVPLELEKLLSNLIPKKSLSAYGVTKQQLVTFAESVMLNQTRLMANNYVKLDYEAVYAIYQSLY